MSGKTLDTQNGEFISIAYLPFAFLFALYGCTAEKLIAEQLGPGAVCDYRTGHTYHCRLNNKQYICQRDHDNEFLCVEAVNARNVQR